MQVDKKLQLNESMENKNKSTKTGGSLELGNQKSENMEAISNTVENAVMSKPLENVEKRLIVCERVSDKHETNCNSLVESSSKQHDGIHENPEALQNADLLINDNGKSECSIDNKNSVQITPDTSKSSEIVDAIPEILVKKVTKLTISAEEKKAKDTNSKVVVNIQSESLKSLMAYEGDSDSDELSDSEPQAQVCDLSSEDEENNTNTKKTWRKNTERASGTSDSESDSSASTLSLESDSDEENSDGDSASVIDVSDDGIRVDSSVVKVNKDSDKGAVKKNNPNILDLEEFLPPLPDLSKLNINVDEADFMHMGRISAVISELVTISAIRGTPAFDLDSMLFVDNDTTKKPIGPIFDVLGPVSEPIYCVRFNTEKEVEELGLKSGMKVYAIPKSEEFTKYVFVQELMKIRGSDASWFHDHETPPEHAEFSDDEKEREAKRAKKTNMKRKLNDGSLERHKRYERTMNQCNTLNTRVCKLMDAHKNLSKHIRPSVVDDIKLPPGCQELPPVPPPLFDPSVPPPGFGQPALYGMPMQPPPFDATRGFGQPATFNSSVSPYNNQTSVPNPFVPSTIVFGHHYANETPSPQSLCPPPARWSWKSQREEFRRPQRSNNPRANQQNFENYFTSHGRNSRGAGPSSQPFD